MADLDRVVLQDQLEAAAHRILAFKRKPGRGYQGKLTVEDVVIVVVARGEDGQPYYIDPAEISDNDPDVFAREYVRVGRERRGVSVLELLERFLPVVSPGAAGLFSALKGIFGGRP